MVQEITADQVQLILLDRDGVINFDSAEFIKSAEEWQAMPGAIEAIAELQQHAAVAVCTNQSGVGRGLFDEATLAAMHDKLNRLLIAAGGQALDVFYCPHHPEAGCPCRKPNPELLQRAMQAYGIAPEHTLYAGDSEKDLLAATNAGCTGVLILTGNGVKTALTESGRQARIMCAKLSDLPGALGFVNTAT